MIFTSKNPSNPSSNCLSQIYGFSFFNSSICVRYYFVDQRKECGKLDYRQEIKWKFQLCEMKVVEIVLEKGSHWESKSGHICVKVLKFYLFFGFMWRKFWVVDRISEQKPVNCIYISNSTWHVKSHSDSISCNWQVTCSRMKAPETILEIRDKTTILKAKNYPFMWKLL